MFCVKIRTYSMFHTFYMLLFILWYILNELDTLAYHNEVYILKCQTCATVVIVVGYANKPYRLGDSLKEALQLFAKIPTTVIHMLHNSTSLFEIVCFHMITHWWNYQKDCFLYFIIFVFWNTLIVEIPVSLCLGTYVKNH